MQDATASVVELARATLSLRRCTLKNRPIFVPKIIQKDLFFSPEIEED
jgi:hypothetical protein